MKVKIFYGRIKDVQKTFNKWIKNLPIPDIYQIETLAFPCSSEGLADLIAIVVYMRA